MSYYTLLSVLLVLSHTCSSQINFGGGSSSNRRPSSSSSSGNSRPSGTSRPSGNSRPSFPSNGGNNGFSFNNNNGNSRPNSGNSRPSFPSNGGNNGFSFNNNNNKQPVSVEFGGGSSSSSNVKSLLDLLGKDAPSPSLTNRRQNVGTRRRGSSCSTPLGEAGTCQYIFSSQCAPILQVILQQGVTQQVLAYLFQVILGQTLRFKSEFSLHIINNQSSRQ